MKKTLFVSLFGILTSHLCIAEHGSGSIRAGSKPLEGRTAGVMRFSKKMIPLGTVIKAKGTLTRKDCSVTATSIAHPEDVGVIAFNGNPSLLKWSFSGGNNTHDFYSTAAQVCEEANTEEQIEAFQWVSFKIDRESNWKPKKLFGFKSKISGIASELLGSCESNPSCSGSAELEPRDLGCVADDGRGNSFTYYSQGGNCLAAVELHKRICLRRRGTPRLDPRNFRSACYTKAD